MPNAKHSSETNEHFSPPDIVEAAREALKVIELDPASSEKANTIVKAKNIISLPRNGLLERWYGRVFINPPGGLVDDQGRPVIRKANGKEGCTVTGECGLPPEHTHSGVTSSSVAWWRKLARSWFEGDVEAAVFLAFSIEFVQTSQDEDQLVSPLDCAACYPRDRIRFLREKDGELVVGASPTHASCLFYLPARWDLKGEHFKRAFSKIGKVVRP